MKKSIVGNLVRFTFDDGLESLEFDCNKLSITNRAYAVPFGMCHRLGDMAAIQKSAENKYTVTEAMRRAEVAAGIAQYNVAETWDMSKGARAAPMNPTILKIAAKFNITYEQAMVKVAEQFLADMAEEPSAE